LDYKTKEQDIGLATSVRWVGRQNARARVRFDKIFAFFLSIEKERTRPA
jgi:hypothetical protein